MTERDKELLIALIKGLCKTANATQYDPGFKIIMGKDIDILIDFIKRM